MNDTRYRVILYIIVVVILSTISIQVYWNYKNYGINKQQLLNDVQVSLDNAVNNYYANLAQQSSVGIISDLSPLELKNATVEFDSIIHHYKKIESYL